MKNGGAQEVNGEHFRFCEERESKRLAERPAAFQRCWNYSVPYCIDNEMTIHRLTFLYTLLYYNDCVRMGSKGSMGRAFVNHGFSEVSLNLEPLRRNYSLNNEWDFLTQSLYTLF